jgi:hypothetical protein
MTYVVNWDECSDDYSGEYCGEFSAEYCDDIDKCSDKHGDDYMSMVLSTMDRNRVKSTRSVMMRTQ